MITPELSARLSVDGMECVLRVDKVRRDTLVQLAAAWADGGRADIEDALDHLAAVAAGNPTEGELDAAVQGVEAAACMDWPEIRLSARVAAKLRRDIGAVVHRLTPRPRLVDRRKRRPLATVVRQRGEAGAA